MSILEILKIHALRHQHTLPGTNTVCSAPTIKTLEPNGAHHCDCETLSAGIPSSILACRSHISPSGLLALPPPLSFNAFPPSYALNRCSSLKPAYLGQVSPPSHLPVFCLHSNVTCWVGCNNWAFCWRDGKYTKKKEKKKVVTRCAACNRWAWISINVWFPGDLLGALTQRLVAPLNSSR